VTPEPTAGVPAPAPRATTVPTRFAPPTRRKVRSPAARRTPVVSHHGPVAQSGSAPPWHGGGRGFKSHPVHALEAPTRHLPVGVSTVLGLTRRTWTRVARRCAVRGRLACRRSPEVSRDRPASRCPTPPSSRSAPTPSAVGGRRRPRSTGTGGPPATPVACGRTPATASTRRTRPRAPSSAEEARVGSGMSSTLRYRETGISVPSLEVEPEGAGEPLRVVTIAEPDGVAFSCGRGSPGSRP
jgi:hypothetical protein